MMHSGGITVERKTPMGFLSFYLPDPSQVHDRITWVQAELKMVKTAAHTTEVVDGFEVLRTQSVADTFHLYNAITKHLTVHLPSFPGCMHWSILVGK